MKIIIYFNVHCPFSWIFVLMKRLWRITELESLLMRQNCLDFLINLKLYLLITILNILREYVLLNLIPRLNTCNMILICKKMGVIAYAVTFLLHKRISVTFISDMVSAEIKKASCKYLIRCQYPPN